jgi:hypothetical protein
MQSLLERLLPDKSVEKYTTWAKKLADEDIEEECDIQGLSAKDFENLPITAVLKSGLRRLRENKISPTIKHESEEPRHLRRDRSSRSMSPVRSYSNSSGSNSPVITQERSNAELLDENMTQAEVLEVSDESEEDERTRRRRRKQENRMEDSEDEDSRSSNSGTGGRSSNSRSSYGDLVWRPEGEEQEKQELKPNRSATKDTSAHLKQFRVHVAGRMSRKQGRAILNKRPKEEPGKDSSASGGSRDRDYKRGSKRHRSSANVVSDDHHDHNSQRCEADVHEPSSDTLSTFTQQSANGSDSGDAVEAEELEQALALSIEEAADSTMDANSSSSGGSSSNGGGGGSSSSSSGGGSSSAQPLHQPPRLLCRDGRKCMNVDRDGHLRQFRHRHLEDEEEPGGAGEAVRAIIYSRDSASALAGVSSSQHFFEGVLFSFAKEFRPKQKETMAKQVRIHTARRIPSYRLHLLRCAYPPPALTPAVLTRFTTVSTRPVPSHSRSTSRQIVKQGGQRELNDGFTAHTTHLICPDHHIQAQNFEGMNLGKLLQYLGKEQHELSHVWVVKAKWVSQSLSNNFIVHPKYFLVHPNLYPTKQPAPSSSVFPSFGTTSAAASTASAAASAAPSTAGHGKPATKPTSAANRYLQLETKLTREVAKQEAGIQRLEGTVEGGGASLDQQGIDELDRKRERLQRLREQLAAVQQKELEKEFDASVREEELQVRSCCQCPHTHRPAHAYMSTASHHPPSAAKEAYEP